MIKNQLDKDKIISKVNEINQLMSLTKSNLYSMDNLIKENINTHRGIWDGEGAEEYLKSWENISTEIPNIIEIFDKQITNLLAVVNEIKTIE